MRRKLKIVHVTSEVEPFSKSGGLANMTSSLAKAHANLGHEVVVVTPLHQPIINLREHSIKKIKEEHTIDAIYKKEYYNVSYFKGFINKNLPTYFIYNDKYFGNKKSLYGTKYENERFLFFDRAVLELLRAIDFQPDIIHCHDWHTGIIPHFLNGKFKNDLFYTETATVFTIHNLMYQLGQDWWKIRNGDRDCGKCKLPELKDHKKIENINFAKRAILNADVINAVSETYREEILTKDFGEDLHIILKNREDKVYGIVNGIDYNDYNPLTDPGLFQKYSYKSPERKKANKEWLQKKFDLKISPDTPLLCITSRIAEQKGFSLMLKIVQTLLRMNVQILIMGDGDKKILKELKKIEKQSPTKITVTPFDQKFETSIYAGADMVLLPSRFEPCGINQMIGLRYGCIPIVHHIGGLADTVTNFNSKTKKGDGFTFSKYNSYDLLATIARAVEVYKDKEAWRKIVETGMKSANSWKLPAEKYVALYKKALKLKRS